MKILDRVFKKLGYVRSHLERDLVCAWCGEEFKWSGKSIDTPPSFCSKNHRKRNLEARSKRRARASSQNPSPKKQPPKEELDLNMVGRCPTPFKQTHPNYEMAREVINRVDPAMHPYKCVCGGIHIGHRSKR